MRFQGGVFIPEEPVDVPEGQVGLVTIESTARGERRASLVRVVVAGGAVQGTDGDRRPRPAP